MQIPGQRQPGQPHPPIDIIQNRVRLSRVITLGPVRKGATQVEAPFASNSTKKAAVQLETFLGMIWESRSADKVISVRFMDVDQQAQYTLSEAPDVDMSGLHPVMMTVTRGLAGPSTMTEEGHFVLILSDVELHLTMRRVGAKVDTSIKLNPRHFTLRADGVIMVHI